MPRGFSGTWVETWFDKWEQLFEEAEYGLRSAASRVPEVSAPSVRQVPFTRRDGVWGGGAAEGRGDLSSIVLNNQGWWHQSDHAAESTYHFVNEFKTAIETVNRVMTESLVLPKTSSQVLLLTESLRVQVDELERLGVADTYSAFRDVPSRLSAAAESQGDGFELIQEVAERCRGELESAARANAHTLREFAEAIRAHRSVVRGQIDAAQAIVRKSDASLSSAQGAAARDLVSVIQDQNRAIRDLENLIDTLNGAANTAQGAAEDLEDGYRKLGYKFDEHVQDVQTADNQYSYMLDDLVDLIDGVRHVAEGIQGSFTANVGGLTNFAYFSQLLPMMTSDQQARLNELKQSFWDSLLASLFSDGKVNAEAVQALAKRGVHNLTAVELDALTKVFMRLTCPVQVTVFFRALTIRCVSTVADEFAIWRMCTQLAGAILKRVDLRIDYLRKRNTPVPDPETHAEWLHLLPMRVMLGLFAAPTPEYAAQGAEGRAFPGPNGHPDLTVTLQDGEWVVEFVQMSNRFIHAHADGTWEHITPPDGLLGSLLQSQANFMTYAQQHRTVTVSRAYGLSDVTVTVETVNGPRPVTLTEAAYATHTRLHEALLAGNVTCTVSSVVNNTLRFAFWTTVGAVGGAAVASIGLPVKVTTGVTAGASGVTSVVMDTLGDLRQADIAQGVQIGAGEIGLTVTYVNDQKYYVVFATENDVTSRSDWDSPATPPTAVSDSGPG